MKIMIGYCLEKRKQKTNERVKMRFETPPPFLENGSTGKVVNNLLIFLKDWAQKNNKGDDGIEIDGVLGPTGIKWLQEYQKANGLIADGGCGPETRKTMKKRDGFDFDQAATLVDSISEYIQPNGDKLYWVAGIEETTDREVAERRFWRSRRGN
ncbi:MAG: hypothetical protein A3C08_01815 [Candidatus Taylorbacteria bacterium RIFCSPHIGHO2_02_FULL_47_18]|uniref:Peptidoglycan binding-like domain-containing protein n=1 Tax=Candidatus Taylorbacteria bacterium RIFCSPLOWO2_01_FULL_48_100 TaxID=1802322 RepID=A0A1G2NFL5_9BACT|nr:MAG: hypothetical protein A2670_01995 [Candidatus Taylorbacteria bacterium RIFCSPHIGHO2_01_FULL_48_38]OHA28485.1 MAG: hypothetical protein A3C08_01815 [Candidatus Taylorbacteria bacterium RIFCSPHIGHO2_02_FULL_47_18]OHA34864.1 MAG: hypothetical protein A2938_00450 [Candidatus Taylorbacteria bacterium RIFCSPLOWO2_01_FULL_48_100]OHA40239.1 MAG: hypothetical protein A3J31_01520 [Candidatus Taylorbacteria bacterium RIFCSPLOWO2_02_FULL_48_16]OHA45427.1 MAG: hypothetical protein A3H13_01325 [Candid